MTSILNERYSQALFSECGGDILGQGGKLGGFEQVDASRRGDVAESSGGSHTGSAWGLCNDLSPMVHTGLSMLSEVQLLAVNLFKTSISPRQHKYLKLSPSFSLCPRADVHVTSIHLCHPYIWGVQVFNLGPILMKSISKGFFKKARSAHSVVSYLDITTSGNVVSIVKRTDFSLGLFFEI